MSLNKITPTKCLCVGSFLYRKDLYSVEFLTNLWEDRFGDSIQFYHSYFPMKDYYSKEMIFDGVGQLERVFLISEKTFDRELMVEFKDWAQSIEAKYARDKHRTINLDIGLLSLENFVLATTKPYSHRIYLNRGYYAELTYIFRNGQYHKLDWTYPDYSNEEIIQFFEGERKRLLKMLNT